MASLGRSARRFLYIGSHFQIIGNQHLAVYGGWSEPIRSGCLTLVSFGTFGHFNLLFPNVETGSTGSCEGRLFSLCY